MSDDYERTERVEAMQWAKHDRASPSDQATNIVAWVRANGGEARYVENWHNGADERDVRYIGWPVHGPVIEIRQPRGNWIPASPGNWIVRGLNSFYVRSAEQWFAQGWSAASAVPVQVGDE